MEERRYYHLNVGRISTEAHFVKHLSGQEPDVIDPQGDGWYMVGLEAKSIGKRDVGAMFDEWGEGGDAAWIDVEDNGESGLGLWLRIVPGGRWNGKGEPAPIVSVRLSPAQAELLATVLQATAALRRAQAR